MLRSHVQTLAIVPVKRLTDAKQRLASAVPPAARRTLAAAMLGDVLAALRQVDALDEVLVVTADPEVRRIAHRHGALTLEEPAGRGQDEALLRGVACAAELGAQQVLCLAGDCPLLDPAELDALLRRSTATERCVVVVPDRHGTGTNALLLRPPDALAPSYGPDSCARHRRLAREHAVPDAVAVLDSLSLDVDTPADLAALEQLLATCDGRAARTRWTLGRIQRAPLPPGR